MAEWPSVADIKRRLSITATGAIDTDISSAIAAAREVIEADCRESIGDPLADPVVLPVYSFDTEDPPARIREAAILLTVSTYKAPDAPFGVAGIFDTAAVYVAREHPTYAQLLRGYRRDFGIG